MKLYKTLHYTCRTLFVVLIMFLSSFSCRNETPHEPNDSQGVFVQKIAFTSWAKFLDPMVTIADLYNDNGTFQLFNSSALTPGVLPSLSRDASLIVFLFVENGLHLMRINVDGTGLNEILSDNNLNPNEAVISPDGSEVAISYSDRNHPGLHLGLMPVGGGEIKRIYTHLGLAFKPDWTTGGQTLFITYVDYGLRFGHTSPDGKRVKAYLASINRDGTGLNFISDTLNGLSNDAGPAISSDGQKIAFDSQRNYPDNIFPEIFVMDTNGINVQQLTECIGCERHGDHFDRYTMDTSPIWTKDNQYIIFSRNTYIYDHNSNSYNEPIRDLYIIKPDGTGLQNLTKDGVSTKLGKAARW